jgi:hypothetical protein
VAVTDSQEVQTDPGGVQVNFFAPPRQNRPPCDSVVVGDIPQEPPDYQPRPSLGAFLAGLTATADALGVGVAEDAEAAGRAVRHWLEADGSGCLVVFDNATDPDLVQPYLPVAGAARVIITSNQQSVAALGVAMSVEVFIEAEGLAYLAEQTRGKDEAGRGRWVQSWAGCRWPWPRPLPSSRPSA